MLVTTLSCEFRPAFPNHWTGDVYYRRFFPVLPFYQVQPGRGVTQGAPMREEKEDEKEAIKGRGAA